MRALLLLAAVALPSITMAQQTSWPTVMSEDRVTAIKEAASGMEAGCIAELQAGDEGERCTQYRDGVMKVISVYDMRTSWCMLRLDDRTKPVPAVCWDKGPDPLPVALEQIGYRRFEKLSRQVHPDRWARADAARAELAN